MDFNLVDSLGRSVPAIILACAILAVFAGDLLARRKEHLGELALLGAAFSLLSIAWGSRAAGAGWLFHRMLVQDPFATFFQAVVALVTVATVWMSLGSEEVRRTSQGEYYGLMLSGALGMFFMAGANNLLMAYLSLEFVSLTSYVLTGTLRRDRRSGEAALKYLIYGGVASGTMIYGMSWIFGLTGSMDYAGIHDALQTGGAATAALFIAVFLLLAGFGFKITAVPFHMWAPDVYTGAPIPVTTFLAVGSKAAGFALLLRFFYPVLSSVTGGGRWTSLAGLDWPQWALVLSVATMTLGNLTALRQRNLKRLLAYSSIAHAGYLLMGVAVWSDEGLRAVLFYLAIYYLMNVGAFLTLMIIANSTGDEDIDTVRGLAWRGGAGPAVAMAVFLFSLAGIPPLSGFVGKFYLFAAVIHAKLYVLAVIGVLNSVLSLYYYARVVRTMFLDFPRGGEATVALDWSNGFLMWLLTAATVGMGIYWAPVIDLADRSVRFFTG